MNQYLLKYKFQELLQNITEYLCGLIDSLDHKRTLIKWISSLGGMGVRDQISPYKAFEAAYIKTKTKTLWNLYWALDAIIPSD